MDREFYVIAYAGDRFARRVVIALATAVLVAFGFAGSGAAADGAVATTFRWGVEADAASLDPYTRNETVQLALTGNIYEPLIRRSASLSLEPALALSWESTTPTTWRFHLRPGVKWQDGSAFTAADVLFSLRRVQSPSSLLRSVVSGIAGATQVDDLTVDFQTAAPDPILPQEISVWYIMSKAWAERNGATDPALLATGGENFATRHAMGTGPFRLTLREQDQRTVLERNPSWWDTTSAVVDRAEMVVLGNATTRVAALLSGEVDLITAVPPQDADYIGGSDGLKLIVGPELRTIFLGMDQSRDELLTSDVKGRNPFKDPRVREAMALAIDETAIVAKVMRGRARPTWLLWGPGVNGYNAALDHRPAPDPQHARALLADAGYPHGFSVRLDCPNDRYMMDEAICTALVPMLARIGVRVQLATQPKARFFADIGPPAYRTSFYLLGWSPPTYDAHDVLLNLAAKRDGARGAINYGGFADPGLDALIDRIGREGDARAREGLLSQAAEMLQRSWAYIPLHQQMLVWGAKADVDVPQTADGRLQLRLVRSGHEISTRQ